MYAEGEVLVILTGGTQKTAWGVPGAALSITRGVIFRFPALDRPAEQLPYEIFRLGYPYLSLAQDLLAETALVQAHDIHPALQPIH